MSASELEKIKYLKEDCFDCLILGGSAISCGAAIPSRLISNEHIGGDLV